MNKEDFKFLENRATISRYKKLADYLMSIQKTLDYKLSARGWAYILENKRFINKNQFDKVQEMINNCRRRGILPIDFNAEDNERAFLGVEEPETRDIPTFFRDYIDGLFRNVDRFYTPDWWVGEKYYIQMVVEKIDLIGLFEPVCRRFHIPIANSRGWSSMLQRATYARRYAEAEQMGMKPLLLYFGDFDPDGLRISDFINTNLVDLKKIQWSDGVPGFDPANLEIHRFGLNYQFIIDENLTWIDNLITGNVNKKMDLGDKRHPNHNLPYVQNYLKEVGRRKCEANAIVITPTKARELCYKTITSFLGEDAEQRFQERAKEIKDKFDAFIEEKKLVKHFDKIKKILK